MHGMGAKDPCHVDSMRHLPKTDRRTGAKKELFSVRGPQAEGKSEARHRGSQAVVWVDDLPSRGSKLRSFTFGEGAD